jgi:hypothetical protein
MLKRFALLLCFVVLVSGCAGYSTKIQLPNDIQTIYVPTVINRIPIEQMMIYVPGMEADMTNAVIDRFNFDGTLKVVSRPEDADATLHIVLKQFDQEGTRFTNLESIREYRLYITTMVELKDNRTDKVLIAENDFRGESFYEVESSSTDARETGGTKYPLSWHLKNGTVRAVEDYARNVVDLITEAW